MMFIPIEDVAHLIQTALTPAFLLSGIAALLNVFANRLARVADRVDRMTPLIKSATPDEAAHLMRQLDFLRRRTRLLDVAVVLGAIAGALTCLAALLLFVGSLRTAAIALALLVAFGASLIAAIGAVGAFLAEMLVSSRGLRQDVEVKQAQAEQDADLDVGEGESEPAQTG